MVRKIYLIFTVGLLLIAAYAVANQKTDPRYKYSFTPQPCRPFTATGQNLTWTPGTCDAGHRFHICLTVTDSTGQSATSCKYVTIRGACSIYTADTNADSRVDLQDLTGEWLHQFNSTLPQYDINGNGVSDLDDLICVWRYQFQNFTSA